LLTEGIRTQKLRQYICLHHGTLIDVLILVLVGLLPLFWFRDGLLISGNEFNFSLTPTADRFFYTWANLDAPGVESTRNIAQIFFRGTIAFLGWIGIPLVTVEKMHFVFVFMASGLSMYYLVSILIQDVKRRLAALTAAFFWMFNPFVMNYMWHGPMPLELYALFPLIFALFIKGLRGKKNVLSVFLISAISATILSHAGIGMSEGAIYVLILLSYLTLYVVEKRKNKQEIINALKFTALLGGVWLAFNLWWLLPQISALSREISSSLGVTENVGVTLRGTLELESKVANLLNVFRLSAIWSFDSGYKGDPFFSYAPLYSTIIFQLIGFLMPILAFSALLKRKKDVNVLYFSLLALLGLFLMKGNNPPFGGAFIWMFEHIPLFAVFRHFQVRFGPILVIGYAFLIGVTVSSIYHHVRGIKKPNFSHLTRKIMAIIPVLIIFAILFGVYSFPMWTGEVIPKEGKVTPSLHIEIPDYYYEANDWLEEQEDDFNIFGLPYCRLFYATYDWEHGYTGSDPSIWLFSKPTVMGYKGENYELPLMVGEILSGTSEAYQTDYAGELLGLLNVKYVLFHRDSLWERLQADPWYVAASEESIENTLENQEGLILEKSFGKLDFYRNDYWQPVHIYSPGDVTLVEGNLKALPSWASMSGSNTLPMIFLSSDLSQEQNDFISGKVNNFFSHQSRSEASYRLLENLGDISEDFETGILGPWIVSFTRDGSSKLTSVDSFGGDYAAELSLSGQASYIHMYRDFSYDGNSSINLNAWMKVISQTYPSGAFIYLQGYDAKGVEKVRIIYHTYTNWDTPTGTPGEHTDFGSYPFYSMKVPLGDPPLDTWINVDQNPRDEFEANFPGVWEKLNLTKLRLDLRNWGDMELASRYDNVNITNINKQRITVNIIHHFLSPEDGKYVLYASINSGFSEELQYRVDDGELQIVPEKGFAPGVYYNLVELGEYWLGQGSHTIEFLFETKQEREGDNFETGDLGKWIAEVQSSDSSANVCSSDSHSGTYSAELVLDERDNEIYIYKDLSYDGNSSITLNANMKVVSQTHPSGAFIYLQGYDAEDVEKVRIIYHTYANWDTPTGTPGEHPEYGDYPFYSIKVHLGSPPLDTWIDVVRNPKDEFEANFPGVWEKLNLTKIRLRLYNWGDGGITSRYDNVKISGAINNPINYVSRSPQEGETDDMPGITIQNINPTKYQVHVNTTQPVFLVFSESYHSQWKAYYGNTNWIKAFFSKPISDTHHFKVNGYANAWYIDKVGDYDITLYFKSQSWFYLGVIISSVSFTAFVSYLGWKKRKGRICVKIRKCLHLKYIH